MCTSDLRRRHAGRCCQTCRSRTGTALGGWHWRHLFGHLHMTSLPPLTDAAPALQEAHRRRSRHAANLAPLCRLAFNVVKRASCIAEYFDSRRIQPCAGVAARHALRLYTHTTAYTTLRPMTWRRHGPHEEPSPNRAWRSAGCAGTWGPPVGVSMDIQG